MDGLTCVLATGVGNAGINGAASFPSGVSFLLENDEIKWVIFPRWIECFDFP